MYLADYVPRFPKNAHEALFVGESIKQCVVRISNQRNVPMSLEKDQEVIWLRYREKYLVHAYTAELRKHPVSLITRGQVACKCSWSKHLNQVALVRQDA